MSCFDIVVMNYTIYIVSCNFAIHATCLLTLITYKYNELQVIIATQKLSYKANHKRPFFFIMCISYPITFPSSRVLWSQVPSQIQIQL